MSIRAKLKELRRVTKLHVDWLLVNLLGRDALSEQDLTDLEAYNKLPIPSVSLDLVRQSYVLGRLKALFRKSDYKGLNYEQMLSEAKRAQFTPLEQMAIEHAELRAGENLKGVASEITSGVYSALETSLGRAVTEASVQGVVQDETALALIAKKTAEELASSLVEKLGPNSTRDWKRVAETELTAAKAQGTIQAIVNKLDIYAGSDGVDSLVSIIPSTGACQDCKHHYTDASGDPKVFKLSYLLGQGSNADVGVKHTRGDEGRHTGWKTCLTPLHPSCSCSIQYMPPGTGWSAGKLVVLEKGLYETSLQKARAGVSGPGGKPTVAPTGPPKPKTESNPGNIAFAATAKAPTSQPATAVDPVGQTVGSSKGPAVEYDYRPAGEKPGGEGWEQTKSGGWRRPKGMHDPVGVGAAESDPSEKIQQHIEQASTWGKQPRSHDILKQHMATGEITTTHELGDKESGSNKALRCTVAGNGRGLLKGKIEHTATVTQGIGWAPGAGTLPGGTEPHREKAFYQGSMLLGLHDHVPPTETRMHDNALHSMQSWREDSPTAGLFSANTLGEEQYSKIRNSPGKDTNVLIQSVPEEHREALVQQLHEGVTMDHIFSNNDRHTSNMLVGEDFKVKYIDNGTSAGNGLHSIRNDIHEGFHSMQSKVTIPEHLHTRLDNMSFGDWKRGMAGSGLEDWSVGQSFMRSRYVSHLQREEGHLDYEKFRNVPVNIDGLQAAMVTPLWDSTYPFKLSSHATQEQMKDYDYRAENNQHPNEMFESFAKQHIATALADSNHPDHSSIKEIVELGIFMGPGAMKDPKAYRARGEHKEYEKSITAGLPPREVGLEASRRQEARTVAQTMTVPPPSRTRKRGPAALPPEKDLKIK